MKAKHFVVFLFFFGVVFFVRKMRLHALPLPPAFSGYWVGPCNNPGKGHAAPWQVYELNFAKDVEIYYVMYADPYCKQPALVNLALGKAVIFAGSAPNVFHVDITYSKFLWRFLNDQGVKGANAAKLYGHVDWAMGKYVDVTGSKDLKAGVVQSDLLQLQPNSMRWGNNDTGKGLTSDDRPKELDPPEAAYKRIPEVPTYLRPSLQK